MWLPFIKTGARSVFFKRISSVVAKKMQRRCGGHLLFLGGGFYSAKCNLKVPFKPRQVVFCHSQCVKEQRSRVASIPLYCYKSNTLQSGYIYFLHSMSSFRNTNTNIWWLCRACLCNLHSAVTLSFFMLQTKVSFSCDFTFIYVLTLMFPHVKMSKLRL